MVSIGSRLRAERERLGLSQADLAQLAEQSRKSQVRYEADERQPDASYLATIAKHGFDVLYILTGAHIPGHDLIQKVRSKYGSALALAELAESIERIEETEAIAGKPQNRDDLERWAAAIATVEDGLNQTKRYLDPTRKAELILAAYDLLDEDTDSARSRVIRLVNAP